MNPHNLNETDQTVAYTSNDGTAVSYDKFGRTFYTHPSGQASDGSISLNVVNLQFVLSIGTLDVNETVNIDLGGLQNVDPGPAPYAGAAAVANDRSWHAIRRLQQMPADAIPVNDPNYTRSGAVDPDSTHLWYKRRWFHCDHSRCECWSVHGGTGEACRYAC